MITALRPAGRSQVLLAPSGAEIPAGFQNPLPDPTMHRSLLAEMQRLRGRVYVQDGAISAASLTPDGRHVSQFDARSWHLLSLDSDGQVTGCARMLVHPSDVGFDDLFMSSSAIANAPQWKNAVRKCVERELSLARRIGFTFFEAGGWAVSEELRHTTQAARLALSVYAFAQLIGGAVVLTTATIRNHSADILRRIGGKSLSHRGDELPNYFDLQYGCEMSLLRFDSESCAPKYRASILQLRLELETIPVVSSASDEPAPWTHRRVFPPLQPFALAARV